MPTAAPNKAAIGAMVKPADLASLAKSFQAIKQRLADTEAELQREKREREGDADTIAEMLVRIVGLERSIREAAAAGARARDSRPPVVDTEALHRVAALEGRLEEAEARARNAEARASDAESRARAERERAEALARDHEALRKKLAESDIRARSEQERAAQAEEVARAARARAIELAEQIDPMSERGELREERARNQKALEELRERHAVALRDAHEAYAEAFRATLEDERERTREEVEQERAENRTLAARINELEDRLRGLDSRHETALSQLRAELAQLAFDRDAADQGARLSALELVAARAKLELVDRHLEWATSASGPDDTLRERLGAARTALSGEEDRSELPSDGDDDGSTRGGKPKRRVK